MVLSIPWVKRVGNLAMGVVTESGTEFPVVVATRAAAYSAMTSVKILTMTSYQFGYVNDSICAIKAA